MHDGQNIIYNTLFNSIILTTYNTPVSHVYDHCLEYACFEFIYRPLLYIFQMRLNLFHDHCRVYNWLLLKQNYALIMINVVPCT